MSQLIEKKNRQMYFDGANEHQRFGIRKLTIGAASVLLGATLFLGGHAQEAHADTLNTSAPMENNTSTGEEAASQELNNASQDYVPNNPTVEQAETPSAGTTQSQPASVTSETQFANTQSSQASQDQSATLNTYNANQVAQSVNATSTINSQVQSAQTQVQGQIPEANYAQASQDQSAVLNTNNANQGASQVQSNTLNNNVANNTQEATNTSSMLANQVVQNNTNVTNVNSATNTSQNNLAINNTQDYVPNNPTNNKAKINYDALNKANEQANLVLNQPQALHAANLAMNAQNSVLRLSRNLKDNLNNVDNSKLKLFENNLMALRNTNPYLVSLASTGDDDVDISFPDDGNENQTIQDQTFTPQPGEHYDTTQDVKTVTRKIEWNIIKADGGIVQTGHTVTDTITFYEPRAKDDQGHLLDKYSWAHWDSSLDQHFRDCARETEQILKANDNIRLDHVEGGTSADVAGATLITPYSQNQNIKVYFKEGKISTLVRFLDADPNNGRTDGDQVVLSDLSIEGPKGAFINDPDQLNEIRTTLQNYLNQGYKVVDGDNPFSPQIDKDHPHADPNAVEPNIVQYRPVDGAPDNTAINIVLHHNSKDFGGDQNTPNPKTGQTDKNTQKTVTRTISYVYKDGSPVMENGQPKKVVQPVTFSRMAHVDMVTGKVTYDDWGVPKSFSAVKTPQLAGYTPDKVEVEEASVNAESPDIHVTVTYKTNASIKRKAAHLIFKLNNTNTPNITDIPQIQSLPTMMTNGTSGSPMNDKTIPDVFTVDASGVVSGPDSGDTSQWREIASANGVDLDAPAKAGYTWKIAKITGTDTSQDIYFVYSKAPEQSSLKVVVHDNTTNQDLTQYGYDHKDAPGTTVDYDWPTQKQHLLDNGYKIVDEPVVPSTIPNTPQTVTITVEHDIVPDNNTDHKHTPDTPINPNNPTGPKWPAKDNFTKDYTYTVNFNDQNGNKVADPQHQVSTWNRTIYVDKVTGEIKQDQSTPWTSDKTNYDNTNVPVINGYVASKTSKNGSPVSNILPGPKTEQKDTTDTVIYSTVGKIVPVDPNGNPIPGAEQPKYINDPNDPTKVTPNEKVPTIKGKTPRQTSVTPISPTEDTLVIYDDDADDDDDAVDTSLKVIIHDQTDNRDLTGYGFNSGTVKSGTRVPYTFDQDRQKLIDHGYEIVNVPAIPTVYGEKPQTVTITVKHAVAPVNNQDHKHTPGTPINPNDPSGPKWPAKDNYSQDHTYTVNFSSPDGEQLADPKTQTSHWNRTLNIDKVTGEILNPNEPWKSDITNYQDTKVPVINGYVANKTSKNGSPVSKILPGAKAVPSDITDTVIYSTVGKIVPVDPNGKPIPGASTPMYENDPDDPTKVKRTDVPYIKGYTPSVDSVDPKDPTKDTNVVYQKDQPDIVPDNPNENLPSVPNDSNNDLGDFETPKKDTEKVPAKKKVQGITKQAPVNNNTKQPVNNNASLANKAKIPTTNVAQAATLPNKAVANQAPTNNAKKALPQTGEDQNDLMILAVGSLLSAMSLATLAGTRRKRKHE